MAPSLEDRVRSLEGSRIRNVARINACQTLALSMCYHISMREEDPVAYAMRLTAAWKKGADEPKPAPGVDPAYLDALSQEYQEAIADLSKQLLDSVRKEATRLGLPRKTESPRNNS